MLRRRREGEGENQKKEERREGDAERSPDKTFWKRARTILRLKTPNIRTGSTSVPEQNTNQKSRKRFWRRIGAFRGLRRPSEQDHTKTKQTGLRAFLKHRKKPKDELAVVEMTVGAGLQKPQGAPQKSTSSKEPKSEKSRKIKGFYSEGDTIPVLELFPTKQKTEEEDQITNDNREDQNIYQTITAWPSEQDNPKTTKPGLRAKIAAFLKRNKKHKYEQAVAEVIKEPQAAPQKSNDSKEPCQKSEPEQHHQQQDKLSHKNAAENIKAEEWKELKKSSCAKRRAQSEIYTKNSEKSRKIKRFYSEGDTIPVLELFLTKQKTEEEDQITNDNREDQNISKDEQTVAEVLKEPQAAPQKSTSSKEPCQKIEPDQHQDKLSHKNAAENIKHQWKELKNSSCAKRRAQSEIYTKNSEKDMKKKRFFSEGDIVPVLKLFPSKQNTEEPNQITNDNKEGQDLSQNLTTKAPEPVPMTLDKFNFHCVLGEGAYAQVLLTTDLIREEHVAVKIIKKRRLDCPFIIMREHNILKLASRCPFLVHAYAAFQTDSYVCYVMELARRGTLRQRIRHRPHLRREEVRFITAELVCGLQFLHANGILHRDIKPDNILLTNDGHVKISDFGISRPEVFGRARRYGNCGTTGYQAPEMIQKLPYNEGVDWFALGVTLYEMLTRNDPFVQTWTKSIDQVILTYKPSYRRLHQDEVEILKGLLCIDLSKRVGVHANIRSYQFFTSIDWKELEAGNMPSPIKLPKKDKINIKLKKKMQVCDPLDNTKQQKIKDIGFICPTWAEHYYIPSM